jgi:hypothetical protein
VFLAAHKRLAALIRALALVIVAAVPAAGQTNGQFWGTVTLTWLKSSRITYDLELEPKVLVVATGYRAGRRCHVVRAVASRRPSPAPDHTRPADRAPARGGVAAPDRAAESGEGGSQESVRPADGLGVVHPLGDPLERIANRQRIRAGLGYRRNVRWRFEALYIWTRSRDTTDQDFTTSDNIVNLRVKRVF